MWVDTNDSQDTEMDDALAKPQGIQKLLGKPRNLIYDRTIENESNDETVYVTVKPWSKQDALGGAIVSPLLQINRQMQTEYFSLWVSTPSSSSVSQARTVCLWWTNG
jgi:hypothetical protein